MASHLLILSYIEFVIAAREMRGYVQTGEVSINCELHGYQSSLRLSPLAWLDLGGSEIKESDKYNLSMSDGPQTIILENGTTVPSIILRITINNISPADEGNYTCRGVRGAESVTQLIIIEEGTIPTVLLFQTYIPVTTDSL